MNDMAAVIAMVNDIGGGGVDYEMLTIEYLEIDVNLALGRVSIT